MADTVRFRQADATRLPFEDGTFDLTLFQAALVLIDDDREAMREAVRVTKPGGHIGVLELTWLKPPTEQLLLEARQKICARCIAQAKDATAWQQLVTDAGLELVNTHLSGMTRSGFRDESIATMIGVLWRMATRPSVRRRLSSIKDFFKNADGTLGYGIYIGERP